MSELSSVQIKPRALIWDSNCSEDLRPAKGMVMGVIGGLLCWAIIVGGCCGIKAICHKDNTLSQKEQVIQKVR